MTDIASMFVEDAKLKEICECDEPLSPEFDAVVSQRVNISHKEDESVNMIEIITEYFEYQLQKKQMRMEIIADIKEGVRMAAKNALKKGYDTHDIAALTGLDENTMTRLQEELYKE